MALNLVRALDINPLEGLDEKLQAKMMADTSDKTVTPPTEEELQIVEDHMRKRANETTKNILQILQEKPQSVHTLEQSTGLTPIMMVAQTGNTEHLDILLKAMRSWRVKRETEEWAKEDLSATLTSSPTEDNNSPTSAPRKYKYAFKNPTINRHDASGYAPIHHIIYSGNSKALAMVLGEEEEAAATEKNDSTETNVGLTTYSTAPHTSPLSVGCDVNLSTVAMPSMQPTGETPLHLAVRLAGVIEQPSSSPTSSLSISTRNASLSSSSCITSPNAVVIADLTMVKLLLKYGGFASLNTRDDRGRTPLGQLDTSKNPNDAAVIAFLEGIGATR